MHPGHVGMWDKREYNVQIGRVYRSGTNTQSKKDRAGPGTWEESCKCRSRDQSAVGTDYASSDMCILTIQLTPCAVNRFDRIRKAVVPQRRGVVVSAIVVVVGDRRGEVGDEVKKETLVC